MASEQEMLRVVFSADETGHSMGYHTIATALRDAGIEVILAGPQIPREIAYTAIQEGADVIAYRIMAAYPPTLVSKLIKVLQEQSVKDIPIVVGGAILPKQEAELREMGVFEVFPIGSSLTSVVEYFQSLQRKISADRNRVSS